MTIKFKRNTPLSQLLNHHIYRGAYAHYINEYHSHPHHRISLSYSLCCFQVFRMDSRPPPSGNDTRILVPSPLWWQPCTRWVAISHLPPRLHTHSTIAALVAYFGSLISFSYPAYCEGKKIVLALVANCFITKIPHILPVKDGDRVFPVRIQIIFHTKISDKGIVFDPLDLGDAFCNFYSHGQCPSPTQQGATFSVVPTTQSHVHVREKKKPTATSSAINMPPPAPFRANSAHTSVSCLNDSMLASTPRDSKPQNLSYMEHALNSAIHIFNLEAAGPTHDNDNSKLDVSHQSYLKMLTSPAGNHFSKVSAGREVKDKGKTKEDHGAEADSSVNSSLRIDQPVFPMFYPHQVKSVSSGISIGMESQEKELYLSTAQSQLRLVSKSGTLSKSAEKPGTAVHEKKQTAWRKEPRQEWAKTPVVYKRRRMSKLEGQGKDDFIVQSDRANDSDVSVPQETSEAIGEKVMGDLGLSALK